MAYFVGIQSGEIKTECSLADETRVLGRAECESVKLTRVGTDVADERLGKLLAEVSASSGVRLALVRRTCVGMSGFSIARLRKWMSSAISSRLGGTMEVCGDEQIAIDAAFRGGPGLLVFAGIGSIVMGRCMDGTRYTAGGWGPALGDEGSGAWIGSEALRAGFTALDKGESTGILDAAQEAWKLADYTEIVGLAHTHPPPDFSELTPLVHQLAESGDRIAVEVLRRGGEALGDQVMMAWRRMRVHGEQKANVAYTGKVLEQIPTFRKAMAARFSEALTLMEEPVKPIEGALWRAQNPTI